MFVVDAHFKVINFYTAYIGSQTESYFIREHRPSIVLRRDSCHFHKLISPQNEIIVGELVTANVSQIQLLYLVLFTAHCPGSNPLDYTDSFDTYKSHEGKKMKKK